MKILLVNKFHWNKGGSEKYYFELGELLKEHGNEVAYFSMNNEKNIETGDKEYFVEEIDLNTGSKLKAFDVIYSKANYNKMIEAIEDFKPDVIHVNNFQRQLSSSIIKAANDKKIPVVFTAHDVQAICPAITMIDSNNNSCELCTNGKYINCFKKKCIKSSYLKSLLGAIEGNYYRNHKIYSEKISHIITPSDFFKKKFILDGISERKITTIHNFVNMEEYDIKTEDDGYALYFGRLSREKGIINLIKAFSKLNEGILYIAGEGPEENTIKKIIHENKLEKRVKLLGFLDKCQMRDVISKCKFAIVPSICFENCPYSVLETLAIGKPIIGSNMGGIPELVENNRNGYIYKYNDINELSNRMRQLFENKELVDNLSIESKKIAVEKYSSENYYKKIINIYNSLKERKNGKK